MGKGKEIYMYVLGAIVVLCTFAYGTLIVLHEIPAGSKDAVMLFAGQLLGMALLVVGYFYGSSKSSADKNEMIAGKGEGTPAP